MERSDIMIFTERTVRVRNGDASIDAPVILYRGDRKVEIRFKIIDAKFMFQSGDNLISSTNAAFAQLAILNPNGSNAFSEIAATDNGTVSFVITGEMVDQLEEVGIYGFHIRLFDEDLESRITLPEVGNGFEVREPMISEDHDNSVDSAIVGYSIINAANAPNEEVPDTFNSNDDYNKTIWETGDRITKGKLNKIEDALYKINQNEKNDIAALDKRVANNYNMLESNKADKNEIFSMANMGQDVKEAMTGGSVAVVGENTILTENIVDGQVTNSKLARDISIDKIRDFNCTRGINLFDKNDSSLGVYNVSTGQFTPFSMPDSGRYYKTYTSNFISCAANESFTRNQKTDWCEITYWDSDLNFIGGEKLRTINQNDISGSFHTFKMPDRSNLAYFAISLLVESNDPTTYSMLVSPDNYMIIRGGLNDMPIEYIPYLVAECPQLRIMDDNIVDINIEKTKGYTRIIQGGNLFNPINATLGYYDIYTGVFNKGQKTYQIYTIDVITSDYIEVVPNNYYIKNQIGAGYEVVYFDKNKNYISGASNSQSNIIQVPNNSNIKYARFCLVESSDSPSIAENAMSRYDFMIVEGRELPEEYVSSTILYKIEGYELDSVHELKRTVNELEQNIKNLEENIKNLGPNTTSNVFGLSNRKRQLIVDTDWATDVDDVVAMRVLTWAHNQEMIELNSVVVSVYGDNAIPSLEAFLIADGINDIPLGIDQTKSIIVNNSSYHSNMLDEEHTFTNSSEAEDSLDVLRRALYNTREKVDYICVGHMNNVQRLLNSTADDIPLTGKELFESRVRHLWVMGGQFPSGSEYNFNATAAAQNAAYIVFNSNLSVPVTFLGFEVGNQFRTGGNMASIDPNRNDMLTQALYDHGSAAGRYSWDPMTAYICCLEDLDICGCDTTVGTINVLSNGSNTFTTNANGLHRYVSLKYNPAFYQEVINNILPK